MYVFVYETDVNSLEITDVQCLFACVCVQDRR